VILTLGIDPGPLESAYAYVTPQQTVDSAGKVGNVALIEMLRAAACSTGNVAVESIQSYGMAVGRSVFDTCFQIGRIQQACADLYARPEYTRRICGVGKVNDAVLRQALLLRFGGDHKGEPMFKLRGCTDKRSAFAVAVYHIDLTRCERKEAVRA
jgi:hypothetical protein